MAFWLNKFGPKKGSCSWGVSVASAPGRGAFRGLGGFEKKLVLAGTNEGAPKLKAGADGDRGGFLGDLVGEDPELSGPCP